MLVASSVRFLFEAEEIAQQFARFWGQRVSAIGEVTEVLGPRSFVLDDDVVVVTTESLSFQPTEGMRLVTQGAVREFVLVTFEEELGLDLDDGMFEGWEDRPGIIATSVRQLPDRTYCR